MSSPLWNANGKVKVRLAAIVASIIAIVILAGRSCRSRSSPAFLEGASGFGRPGWP